MARGYRIDLDAYGFDLAIRRFRRMGRRAQDFRPVFLKLMRWLRADTRERFARQPWKPLAPATVERKAREGKDPRILRVTGRLEDAMTLWSAPGAIRRLDLLEMFYGLDPQGAAFYGKFHHMGQGTNPERPIIELKAQRRAQFHRAVLDHLQGR